jgi:S-adenosylmethionine-diacylglycerol 3-amino-3-carboxypropyl transferase
MSAATALPTPDAWAVEAATWPLAFAQVREDPRVDLEVLKLLPPRAEVVMIASGGETAVCLERHGLGRLTLVDVNPAQLALARLKRHLSRNHAPVFALHVLGHASMLPGSRQVVLSALLDTLELDRGVFGPIDGVAALGPDHVGRYEITFAELWKELSADHETLQLLLMSDRVPGAADLLSGSTRAGQLLDQALARVMSLQNLVCLFGEEATRNPRQPFDRHFAARLRANASRGAAAENPFLWQMLVGMFPPGHPYDWLKPTALASQVDWLPPDRIQYLKGRMAEVLETLPKESADLVHLSNILDWLSPDEATACLKGAARVLRKGGRVLIRQLNSSLDIPALASGFQWDAALGASLHARDRSFFYSAIHVGRKE